MTCSVLHYTQLLCNALEHDFMNYTIVSHNRSIQKGENVEHHNRKLQEIAEGIARLYRYVIVEGKRYFKVVMLTESSSQSVHCFVDKVTGDVYKSASWRSPAKGVRYSLLDDDSREQCFANADWAGGYLYA